MPRGSGCLIAIVALALATPLSARQEAPAAAGQGRVLVSTDRTLTAALDRIAGRSALWRDAVADVARRDRQVLVLTPDQVVVADSPDAAGDRVDAFDATSLAEVSPVIRDGAAVDVVMVVVNVPLLADLHGRLGGTPREFEEDLERVLIHEVYGHAIPYLQAGDVSGRCPDPERGRDPGESCSVRRENAVRAEAGLGQRRDYALGGLVVLERLARTSAFSVSR